MWAGGGCSTLVEQLAAGAEKAAAFGRISPDQGSSPTSHPNVADLDFAGGQADGMPTAGKLIEAATEGDLEEMRRLIEAGAEIDERDEVSEGGGSVSVGRGGWLLQSHLGRAWIEGGGVRFEGGRSGCAGCVRFEEESVEIVHNWDD